MYIQAFLESLKTSAMVLEDIFPVFGQGRRCDVKYPSLYQQMYHQHCICYGLEADFGLQLKPDKAKVWIPPPSCLTTNPWSDLNFWV
jgi:hypothetical protein